ncbi:MAG: NAD(P)-dependent oxidoreductase [Candidatus Ornithomonoglobus sp.]
MDDIKIAILDAETIGGDIDYSIYDKFGKVEIYENTNPRQVQFRVMDVDVIIINKVKLDESNLASAKKLKLICIAATGYDNVDIEYCRRRGIAVCNVRGYSTDSVAQLTVSMALSLVNHISQYDSFVKSGRYSESGAQNCLKPVFHELRGMTWGIAGLGAIGMRVAEIAKVLGCEVLAFKRRRDPLYRCVTLQTLCEKSDIISVHLPLSEQTRGIVSREMILHMKKNAIVINAARGAVVDEAALADAMTEGRIGGLGVDVYSTEPIEVTSPYMKLADNPAVIFTPHMAWGAYEARVRCMEEIICNIEAFFKGKRRNRVDA